MAVNRTLLALIALGAAALSNAHQVVALEMKPVLPIDLATQAAQQAVNSCEKKGFAVTATVIEPNGTILVAMRHQNAGPHTIENSFNKAYTVSSFGRIAGFTSTKQFIKAQANSKGIGSFSLPAAPLYGLSYSPGGFSINSGGQLIGAIGVSGAKSGDIDSECAIDGLSTIEADIN